jgi:hypothetical protein
MGSWEVGLAVSLGLLVVFSPVIAGAYLLVRWPVRRVIAPEHPVVRRVVTVVVLLVLGKILFSLPQ